MRYIALLGQAGPHAATERAARALQLLCRYSTSWQPVCVESGMLVFCRDADARRRCVYRTTSGAVVLGKLFHHARNDEVSTADELNARDASELSRTYWGRYIGLEAGPNGGYRLFRDPTAALPCYFAHQGALTVAFSNLEDFRVLFPAPLSVNWHHLSRFLCADRTISADTGFMEVTQVLGGECVTGREDRSTRSFFWSPAEVYERGTIEAPGEAAAQLANTARCCVQSWAACYDTLVHQLSGGLDSAIVLSCFPAERPDVICLNTRTATFESDEAELARLAAKLHRRELIEVSENWSSQPLERMLRSAHIASPLQVIARAESDSLRECLVEERGVQALFTGQGGDHLFQRRLDPVVASEFVQLHGLKPRLLSVIEENARMSGHSVWTVARACMQHGILHRRWEPYPDFTLSALLTDTGRDLADRAAPEHPWLSERGRLPIAKHKQLYDVVDCQALYAAAHSPVEWVHPLLSQPLIECCLRIPTYVLSLGGVDRGLARKAFADVLPPQILQRQTKGRYTSYWHKLVTTNLPFIREMLLDGELARAGVLSRSKTEAALSGAALLRGTHLLPLIQAIFAEAWATAAVTSA